MIVLLGFSDRSLGVAMSHGCLAHPHGCFAQPHGACIDGNYLLDSPSKQAC
jgi:hypothetical protein